MSSADRELRMAVYGFADLWISTVLQVLSEAWQIVSILQSAHFGLRAMQRARPW